jgi:hypothetical protein
MHFDFIIFTLFSCDLYIYDQQVENIFKYFGVIIIIKHFSIEDNDGKYKFNVEGKRGKK